MIVNGLIAVPAIFAFGALCLYIGKGPRQPQNGQPPVNGQPSQNRQSPRNNMILPAVALIILVIAMLVFLGKSAIYGLGGLALGAALVWLTRAIGTASRSNRGQKNKRN
jgi:hypothetical protein